MQRSQSYRSTFKSRRAMLMIPVFVLLVSVACGLPGITKRTTPTHVPRPTSTSTPLVPTPTPQPLSPAVVETDPQPGVELALNGSIVFYFNQPMDHLSVESALKAQTNLTGNFSWIDDSTLVFTPSQPFTPQSQVNVDLGSSVRSKQGLALAVPVSYKFQTVGYLSLAHALPEPNAEDVNPTSAVVASFNYPVVPLGADPSGLPAGFSLEPAAQGHGEWLNTSAYIFYPDPPLEGGKSYSVQINPQLRGVDGSPLKEAASWSFTTAAPRLVSLEPSTEAGPIRLDSKLVLTFNQPMDAASVEANFSLRGPDSAPVPGKSSWDEKGTILTFAPDSLLARNATYTVVLNKDAQARGGTPLDTALETNLTTVPSLQVESTTPVEGALKQPYEGVFLKMSGPLADKVDLKRFISVSPEITNLQIWYNDYDRLVSVFGDFLPDTDYIVRVAPGLPDPWGGTTDNEFSLNFRGAPLPPSALLAGGGDVLFLMPQDAAISAQVTNFDNVPMSLGSLPLVDFTSMLSGQDAYNLRQSYTSNDQRTWTQRFDLTPNRAQAVSLYVSPNKQPLNPGLYYLRFSYPQQQASETVTLLVVSNVQLTFKLSPTEALVWAVDLRSNSPVQNAIINLYDMSGSKFAAGQTDSQGIARISFPAINDPYNTYYAVLGNPGNELFSLAISTWNAGSNSWDFGITSDYSGPRLEAYLYTDRPIYRPGQTVYFRAVLRQAYNGRYTLPDITSLPLTLYKNYSEEIANFNLKLSPYGTVNGEYTLPEDAQPGDYRLASKSNEIGINVAFQVAEYRKPEINLQVKFDADQVLAGQKLTAEVDARYFFDAPAGNLPIRWTLTESPSFFSLPGYQVGVEDTRWLDAYYFPGMVAGSQVDSGEAVTDPQGKLSLEFPTNSIDSRRQYTLEITANDESELPVSARATTEINPTDFYIGIHPDAWVGRAGDPSGFDVLVVDWQQNPAGDHNLRGEFKKVTWVREDGNPADPAYAGPKFTPQYTPIGSTDFKTGANGQARLSFTPPEPGTYQLDVSGGGALSQVLLWVGGPGQVTWPNLPNQRLRLTADRTDYKPGDTAEIFIPNPFGVDTPALVTLERSVVLSQTVETIPASGTTLSLPLTADHAPNIYLSVMLLGKDAQGLPSYRLGYLNLPVAPTQQTLKVALTSQPERAGPGDEVAFGVQVTDAAGNPVQGEFSLSVVDLATLALADPNAPDIVPYFYSQQPLGVRTGLPLSAYAQGPVRAAAGGMGGGGGEIVSPFVREKFPDTAYWNAEIVTGADGKAQVSLQLPDNLTTWQVSARGVTPDTRVGQADTHLVTTKELLVRPVTPRFLVVGDHTRLAAIVQNNTQGDLQVSVSLKASGLNLDDQASETQQVSIPAGGRSSVEWWGTAQDVDSADLVFSASGGNYIDASRPANGMLPVLHYTAPQTFASAGTLEEGGKQIELISLPRSFDPQNGNLHVELSTSLAGSMMSALDVLEHSPYESTEQTLSRFLPNLELHLALQQLGINSPATDDRLQRTLDEGLDRLQAYQNSDGGWSWWQGGPSDAYISAYVLFGLSRTRQAGITVDDNAIQRAVQYLSATLAPANTVTEAWQLDRMTFESFALAEADSGNLPVAESLYQVRDQLSPWSQALLALTLEKLSPGSEEVKTLSSDLASSAIRSATGAHWEEKTIEYANMNTPLSTTAIVVYALAQLDPASPVLPDALRYLMANRQADGAWISTYTTAWTVLAGVEAIQASHELEGNFAFSAELNGLPLSSGQAGADSVPVSSDVPLAKLYPDYPNALSLQRAAGPGVLYYTTALQVSQPVEGVAPLDKGISISRAYYPYTENCQKEGQCAPITESKAGDMVKVRLTLTLKNDAYYLMVEDFIPGGSEILNTRLKTSQQVLTPDQQPAPLFDPSHPFEDGWGWWLFNAPRVYDDHIAWSADYLPAGTYELTYYVNILQPGEYRVLPAHAWQFYFPEVQGNNAGMLFAIKP
jgi:alpha-2-macroglobulin